MFWAKLKNSRKGKVKNWAFVYSTIFNLAENKQINIFLKTNMDIEELAFIIEELQILKERNEKYQEQLIVLKQKIILRLNAN